MTNGEAGSSSGGSSRPTLWISLAAVFALAAIGLGIWGASKSSDLDKANKKVSKAEAQLASTQGAAAKTKAEDIRVEKREIARYQETRSKLLRADRQTADFKAEVTKQANELAAARRQLTNARTEEERLAARAKVASEGSDVAVACAQGTVDAIGEFMNQSAPPTDPSGPAERAMKKLEGFQAQCQSVLND